jgi:hypothetical protein
VVVVILFLAALPLSIVGSVARERSERRRSRFWARVAALVIGAMLPWTPALFGAVGEDGFGTLLWVGLAWALMLVALSPFVLFGGPEPDPGASSEVHGDDGPGGGPDRDRPLPDHPRGGIPLPDAEPSGTRLRGPHSPRRAARPRRQPRKPQRRPSRLSPLRPWPYPRHPAR